MADEFYELVKEICDLAKDYDPELFLSALANASGVVILAMYETDEEKFEAVNAVCDMVRRSSKLYDEH